MSDERDLTPEQEARVARLLADARADEPIPPAVAARLDSVLAGMKHEQIAGPGRQIAPVIDLAARWRRRAATLLAAAAAVVVAGVGIGQVVGPSGSDDSANSADSGGAGDTDAANEERPNGVGSPVDPLDRAGLGLPARITAKSFADDVRRLQDHPGVRSFAADDTMMNGKDLAAPRADFSCSPAAYGAGKLMAVYYNGRPAVLAYRPATGDTQVVELLQCGRGEPIRSTTIPLP